MALIERLMELKDNGTPMTDEDRERFIPLRIFVSRMGEFFRGKITGTQFKASLSLRSTVDASGRSDEQDADAIAALVAPMNQIQKFGFRAEMEDVLSLATLRRAAIPGQRMGYATPGYTTPAEVRAKLGI